MFLSWAPKVAAMASYSRDDRPTDVADVLAKAWMTFADLPKLASTAPMACSASDAALPAERPNANIPAPMAAAGMAAFFMPDWNLPILPDALSISRAACAASARILMVRIADRPMAYP